MNIANEKLKALPSVDKALGNELFRELINTNGEELVKNCLRDVLGGLRESILRGATNTETSFDYIKEQVANKVNIIMSSSFKRVVNATGTILHTNLGRALLSEEAIKAMANVSECNVNLEFDIKSEGRGNRDDHVESLIKTLTGAESAIVVNNNAAAVFLVLNSLAFEKEVVVSRGEQIEIGGSFRLPDIIKQSGCILKEVGTTNRTHLKDYNDATDVDTAVFLKVHTSNYKVVGFTNEVSLKDLSLCAVDKDVALIEDLGSGLLVDLSPYGIKDEPLVSDSIKAGVDVVTFSGDKLLGGPQAGIIAGKKELIDIIKSNHLKRALRADKVTLSALEATLKLYLDESSLFEKLPTLRFISRPIDDVLSLGESAKKLLENSLGKDYTVNLVNSQSEIGSGALPGQTIDSYALEVSSLSMTPSKIYSMFLKDGTHSVLGRVSENRFLLDLRTIDNPEDIVPFNRQGVS